MQCGDVSPNTCQKCETPDGGVDCKASPTCFYDPGDGQIPALGPYVLPGNNYHVYDYALFWEAIRRDSQRRLQAYNHL